MHRRPLITLLCLASATVAGSGASGQSVSHVIPAAAPPGKTTDLTLHGANLAGAHAVWTTVPADVTFPPDKPPAADRVTCRLALPPDAQVGIHALRVATRTGVSDLRLFMVDDLPTVAEGSSNTSPGA